MSRAGPVLAMIAIAGAVALTVSLARTESDERRAAAVGFNNNAVAQGVAAADEAAALIAEVGGEIDRVQIDWDRLEPRPGDYEWRLYDEIYRADLARGIRPLFIFAYAPEWANGGVCPDETPGCHAGPTADHVDEAARTAAEIAARYPDAAGIEVWNEPNLSYFWRPRPDPARYTQLLRAVHEAIKHEAPEMPVAGGSTADIRAPRPGQIPAADFIRAIHAFGGGQSMDALSVHAYPDQADPSGRSAVEDVELATDAMEGDRKPIWVTETGTTTTGAQAVGPEVQALSVLNTTERLLDVRGVEMVLVHTLVQPPRDPASTEPGFGLLGPDLTPTRAYCVLAESWSGTEACAD